MLKTLIMIITYNGLNHVKACLKHSFTTKVGFDFLIIDNASTDDTIKFIRENYPSIMIIENEKNLGFGAANNIGLRKAIEEGYDYVYLLNQDAWINPENLSRLIDIAERNSDYGIISPMQVYAGKDKIDNNFSEQISKEMKDDFFISNHAHKELYWIQRRMLQAAHWLVSVRALKKVGGFSPSFFHYGEDTNLCRRMEFHGFKLGIASDVMAVHDRENRIHSRSYYFHLSTNVWIQALSDPNLSRRVARKQLIEKMFKTLLYYPKGFIPALFHFLWDLPQIRENRRISIFSTMPFL